MESLKAYTNKNFESDIRYNIFLNRHMLRILGAWPFAETKSAFRETLRRFPLIFISYFLLCYDLIPLMLYIILIETKGRIRMKLVMSAIYTVMAILKYTNMLFYKNKMRNCLTQLENDWRNISSERDRNFMISKAKIARYLSAVVFVFMCASGTCYRTIVPLLRKKIVTTENITIRHLPSPNYFIVFDVQLSPAYEIVFVIQIFSGVLTYIIVVAVCSFAAIIVMHVCGQLQILIAMLNDLTNESDIDEVDKKFMNAVEHQNKTRSYLDLVQNTLQFISLTELLGCTLTLCLIGYSIILEWEDSNTTNVLLFNIGLISVSFNIFIFCFIGEQLSEQIEKLSLTVCTLDWYRLPNAKARELVLITAMTNLPVYLKAGKFIDLSFRTFGNVIKTSAAYINLLRTTLD